VSVVVEDAWGVEQGAVAVIVTVHAFGRQFVGRVFVQFRAFIVLSFGVVADGFSVGGEDAVFAEAVHVGVGDRFAVLVRVVAVRPCVVFVVVAPPVDGVGDDVFQPVRVVGVDDEDAFAVGLDRASVVAEHLCRGVDGGGLGFEVCDGLVHLDDLAVCSAVLLRRVPGGGGGGVENVRTTVRIKCTCCHERAVGRDCDRVQTGLELVSQYLCPIFLEYVEDACEFLAMITPVDDSD